MIINNAFSEFSIITLAWILKAGLRIKGCAHQLKTCNTCGRQLSKRLCERSFSAGTDIQILQNQSQSKTEGRTSVILGQGESRLEDRMRPCLCSVNGFMPELGQEMW